MTLTLELPPETEKKLQARAAEAGRSVEGVALQLLEEALGVNGGKIPSHAGKTFDQILAPVRVGWQESGLSEDQVDQLFDETLKKVRAEKRKKNPQ
jgi:hypothetical protein